MIKKFNDYIKESLLDKLEGPNFDDLIKNFNGINKLLDYAIEKRNNNLLIEILKRKGNNKEIFNRIRNFTTHHFAFDVIIELYNINKEDEKLNSLIMTVMDTIFQSSETKENHLKFIDKILEMGFTFNLSNITKNLIFFADKNKRLKEYILSMYERRKKKFFSNKFKKEQLDCLDYFLELSTISDDIKTIDRIFEISDLKDYNHKTAIKLGILKSKFDTLEHIFKHDGGIKPSDEDYLTDSLNRMGYIPNIIRLLLKYNIKVEPKHIRTASIWYNPHKSDNKIIFKELVDRCEINNEILYDIREQYADVFEILFERGYDVHYHDDKILVNAVHMNHPDVVEVALRYGSDPNTRRGELIYSAMNFNDYDTIKYLLEYGYKFTIPRRILLHYDEVNQEIKELIDKWYEEHPEVEEEANKKLKDWYKKRNEQ